jgi:uncharacterized membrane protein
MDALHVHLLLNHFPVIGTIIGIALLLFGFFRKSDEIKRASLGVFFVIALLTVPVYLTGEPAEERVEKSPGVSEAIIEQHEAAALPALIAMEVTGLLAVFGLILFYKDSRLARWNVSAVLVLSLVTFGLMARAANLGGQIRHQEIRSGQTATTNEKPSKIEKDDDEDKD